MILLAHETNFNLPELNFSCYSHFPVSFQGVIRDSYDLDMFDEDFKRTYRPTRRDPFDDDNNDGNANY